MACGLWRKNAALIWWPPHLGISLLRVSSLRHSSTENLRMQRFYQREMIRRRKEKSKVYYLDPQVSKVHGTKDNEHASDCIQKPATYGWRNVQGVVIPCERKLWRDSFPAVVPTLNISAQIGFSWKTETCNSQTTLFRNPHRVTSNR